jgi:hypothetical protein
MGIFHENVNGYFSMLVLQTIESRCHQFVNTLEAPNILEIFLHDIEVRSSEGMGSYYLNQANATYPTS